jgi:hypothetical protein
METRECIDLIWTITGQCQREPDALISADDKAMMQNICLRGPAHRDISCYETIMETLVYLEQRYTETGIANSEFHRLYPRAGELSDCCQERIRQIRSAESVAQLAEMQRLLEAHQRHLMACQRLLDHR